MASILKSKRKNIVQDHPNPYQEFIDKSYLNAKQDIKASTWLEYIDYAILKCHIDLKKYKELSAFLDDSDKIYCSNIKDKTKK